MEFFKAYGCLLFICFSIVVGSENEIASFKNYIKYKIGDNVLYLAPELSKNAKIMKDTMNPIEGSVEVKFVINKNKVHIRFSPGESDDQTFVVSYNDQKKYLEGEELYISSNGTFYLIRETNEDFKKRLKLIFQDDQLIEVAQPFYLVDLKCEASTDFRIYDKKCNSGEVIATIPKGTTVNILLVENDSVGCSDKIIKGNTNLDPVKNYLVATPFGLVGWVASSTGYLSRPGNPLSCITFHGD
jgi:hypothetical protein